MSTCQHRHRSAVTLIDGTPVRELCFSCDQTLPIGYGCEDCDWTEVVNGLGQVLTTRRDQACERHENGCER